MSGEAGGIGVLFSSSSLISSIKPPQILSIDKPKEKTFSYIVNSNYFNKQLTTKSVIESEFLNKHIGQITAIIENWTESR